MFGFENLDTVDSKSLAGSRSWSLFATTHVQSTPYSFCVMYCLDSNCSFCSSGHGKTAPLGAVLKMARDLFLDMPFPQLDENAERAGHYLSFESARERPRVAFNAPSETANEIYVFEEDGDLQEHVKLQNIRGILQCTKCNKKRCVYSNLSFDERHAKRMVADIGGDFVCGSDCVRVATVDWKIGSSEVICFTNVQYVCASAMEPHFYLHLFPTSKTSLAKRSKRLKCIDGDINKDFPSCIRCGLFVGEYLPAKYLPDLTTRPEKVPICAKCRVDKNQTDILFSKYKKPKRSTIDSLLVPEFSCRTQLVMVKHVGNACGAILFLSAIRDYRTPRSSRKTNTLQHNADLWCIPPCQSAGHHRDAVMQLQKLAKNDTVTMIDTPDNPGRLLLCQLLQPPMRPRDSHTLRVHRDLTSPR